MEIQFLHFSGARNEIRKTYNTIATFNGNFRNDVDVKNPIFTVNTTNTNIFNTVNSFYIPAFSRYYFLESFNILRTGIVEIRVHVDVLSSFKDSILQNSCIVKRGEKLFNAYLPDEKQKKNQYTRQQIKIMPTVFSAQPGSIYLLTMG